MPPVTTAPGKGRGFWFDKLNSRLAILYNGTAFLRGTATALTVPEGIALTVGDLTISDGGTVTQATSITTGVTLSAKSGQITTVTNPAIAAGAEATFTVTNTKVGVTDVVIVNVNDQFTDGLVIAAVTAIAAGSFDITLTNVSAAAVSAGTAVINFIVIDGSSS